MPGLAGDQFGHGHTFLLGLVGQHGAGDHVADRVNAVHVRAVLRINFHKPALVQCDARLRQSQVVRKRAPADGDEHDVRLQRFWLATLGGFDGQLNASNRGFG